MKGSILMGGTLIVAAVAGIGLWYSITVAYYEEVTDVTSVYVGGELRPVAGYAGIDADTSPLKMRACFTVDWSYPETTGPREAEPLVAPGWFDCFDAVRISDDLKSDQARVIRADSNTPYGFDTFIAQYPDGRAFMWRQINPCGEAAFSGNELPDNCPAPDDQSRKSGANPHSVAHGPTNKMTERT